MHFHNLDCVICYTGNVLRYAQSCCLHIRILSNKLQVASDIHALLHKMFIGIKNQKAVFIDSLNIETKYLSVCSTAFESDVHEFSYEGRGIFYVQLS